MKIKRIFPGLIVVMLIAVGSLAAAQVTGGGGMMGGEGHRYGAMGGYLWWWGVYGFVKAAAVVFALWLLYRITRAVERIASSKP